MYTCFWRILYISKVSPPIIVLSKIETSLSYFLEILNNIHGPDPCALYTFHLPNLMSNSHLLHRSKGSVQVPWFCEILLNAVSCYGVELLAIRPNSKLEDTPCRISAVVYSVYYQLLFIRGSHLLHRKLRSHRTVMAWTHLVWLMIYSNYHHNYHHHLVSPVTVAVLL